MYKVSIIIPVYNVEKYVSQCIESIVKQTYKNIEIILIDDGSSDKSGNICDEWKRRDKRIEVIHKENQGVSEARNKGLEVATGKYIMFADSDDYLDKHAVEIMVKNIQNYDMAICGYIETFVDENIQHEITNKKNKLGKEKAIELLFDSKYYGGYLWNKIFIAEKIKENNLRFNSEIHMCEDLLFVCKYLLLSEQVILIPQTLYYYRMRKSSMVWNMQSHKFKSLFDAYNTIYELLENNEQINKDNLKYMIVTDVYKHKNKIKEFNLKQYKRQYYYLLFNSDIDNIKKIKLIVIKYAKFIYVLFLKRKLKKLKQFE